MQKPQRPGRWSRPLVALVALGLVGTGCRPPGPAALLKGDALLQAGKVDAAVAQIEKAIRYRDLEGNAQAWNHLGLAYHRQGQPKKAEQAYMKALNLDRNLSAARLNLGYLYLETGNNVAAADAFTTFCTLKADLPEAWLRLGQSQVRAAAPLAMNERGRLLDAARSNLEYAPAGAEKMNLLGEISYLRGRPREATSLFSAAIQADPKFAPAVLNLAVAYHQLGDKRSALAAYRGFLGMVPRSTDNVAIESAVAALDAELNPPAVVAVPPTNPPPATISNAVAAVTPTAVEAPVRPTVPAPKPNDSAPKVVAAVKPVTNPPPTTAARPVATNAVPQTKPVEKVEPSPVLARINDSPAIRPATTDAPPPSDVPPKAAAATDSGPTYNLTGLTNVPARGSGERSEKKGFFSRLNPTGWFGGDEEKPKPQPKPQGKPVLTAQADVAPPRSTPVEPVPAPQFPRYAYQVKSAPASGNRLEAQRYFNSGLEAHRIRRESAAVEDYAKALAADPAFYEAHFNSSLAYQTLREIPNALREAEYAVALQPKSNDARYQLAQLLDVAGYPEDAVAQAREAVAIKDTDARAHLLLGTIYSQKLMNAPQARIHYQRFLELDPKNPASAAVRYWLATTQ